MRARVAVRTTRHQNQTQRNDNIIKTKQHFKALDAGKRDARVRGLLALLGERSRLGGLAQVQELRAAVADFRVRGKNGEGG